MFFEIFFVSTAYLLIFGAYMIAIEEFRRSRCKRGLHDYVGFLDRPVCRTCGQKSKPTKYGKKQLARVPF
jgi:hypothetical protein